MILFVIVSYYGMNCKRYVDLTKIVGIKWNIHFVVIYKLCNYHVHM